MKPIDKAQNVIPLEKCNCNQNLASFWKNEEADSLCAHTLCEREICPLEISEKKNTMYKTV